MLSLARKEDANKACFDTAPHLFSVWNQTSRARLGWDPGLHGGGHKWTSLGSRVQQYLAEV